MMPILKYKGRYRLYMGFSKSDFEKLDDRISKITEQTVNEIEINDYSQGTAPSIA